jgi:hypothetical protein
VVCFKDLKSEHHTVGTVLKYNRNIVDLECNEFEGMLCESYNTVKTFIVEL